jgi:beta-galactosidase
MEKLLTGDKIILGTCYYPEHWDRALWKDDLRRMKENGIEVIRIAEFAWSKFEPVEGAYTFDFFDDFMEYARAADMGVIFCTPTATPPAWLTEAYPEVLNARIDGTLYRHGGRRHYNYNSPVYRRFTEQIVEKLGEHYGGHPNILGWQLDNELNCQVDVFYSESDTLAYREFLKKKYGSLDALNRAWGNVFWNQEFTTWGEVYVPRPTVSDSTNPGAILDYIRFVSESCRAYAKLQSDILRKYLKPGDFITTNGMFGNLDNHLMTGESLDFFCYDSYPAFAFSLGNKKFDPQDLNDRRWSRNLAEVRSISPIFGIMEQQSGPPGSHAGFEAPAPKPGQMTLWTMQSIAHGADYVSYFRWRTCAMGTEIYWHGILDYSGRDNRRLAELKDLHQKTRALASAAGSPYEAAFGVLKDYDNVWDARIDTWHGSIDRVSEAGIFQAAQLSHTPLDYVYLSDSLTAEDLKKYPVLFYPHAVILREDRVKLLEDYVRQGGTLVLGCRAGYKDDTGKCPMRNLPGLLQELSGTDVPEYTFVGPDDGKIMADWEGTFIEAAVFNDILAPLGNAKVLALYQNNYYAGQPALIRHDYGRGKVYYFGGAFSAETALVFLEKLGIAKPYRDLIDADKNCEIAVRSGPRGRFLFILNYAKISVQVTLKEEMEDIYSGKMVSGKIELPPFGTAVYRTLGGTK